MSVPAARLQCFSSASCPSPHPDATINSALTLSLADHTIDPHSQGHQEGSVTHMPNREGPDEPDFNCRMGNFLMENQQEPG